MADDDEALEIGHPIPVWGIAVIVLLLLVVLAFWVYLAIKYFNKCPCTPIVDGPLASTLTETASVHPDSSSIDPPTKSITPSVCDASVGLVEQDGQCVCAGEHRKWCESAQRCVNVQSDSDNCGGCDYLCGDWERCENGQCVCMATMCFDLGHHTNVCTDVQTNPEHCGACQRACAAGEVCQNGLCVATKGKKQ